ncbi:MAG: hypothetical protein GEU98_29280 [Pseudonocardiaceae bacterium]|nr:hypothetical protein [Pseudonocardiaceae bacterium]
MTTRTATDTQMASEIQPEPNATTGRLADRQVLPVAQHHDRAFNAVGDAPGCSVSATDFDHRAGHIPGEPGR